MKDSLRKLPLVGFVATMILVNGLFASNSAPCKCDGAVKSSTDNSSYINEEKPGGYKGEKDSKKDNKSDTQECCSSGACYR